MERRVARFMVTGGAGFIGSAVVRRLIGHTAHEVLVVDALTYAGNLDSLAGVAGDPRYAFVQADIRDAAAMAGAVASFRPDVIMHLAAESHVDRSIDGPAAFIDTNVTGTFTLLQAALGHWRTLDAAGKEIYFCHWAGLQSQPGTGSWQNRLAGSQHGTVCWALSRQYNAELLPASQPTSR